MACWCLLPLVTLLYVFFDVNYFIRIILTIGFGRLFKKKIRWNDCSTLYGLCTTNDVDIFLRHMNNARYIRELDFARFDFYDRTNIYKEITKCKGNALQGASSVRYRRTIPIFSPYKITTRVVGWEDKAIFLEQQFITLSDDFVRAVVISKQNIVGADVDQLMETLNGGPISRPPLPEELEHWLQSIEISSSKLRKKD